MREWLRYAGQAGLYLLFAVVIGTLSTWPSYRLLEPDQGLLRLSFSHPGKISTDCRTRSAEELAKLQPQMRSAQDCQRERSPVMVRVELDGRVVVDQSFAPAGLSRDGASSGYRRLPIAVGSHRLKVHVRDDMRAGAPTYERESTIDVKAGQIVLIDFKPEQGYIAVPTVFSVASPASMIPLPIVFAARACSSTR